MPLQQMAEAQDGGLIGHTRGAIQTSESPIQRTFVQLFFHRGIAQVPPQLQAVNTQHRLHCERWATAQCLVRTSCMRCNQRYQLRPRYDLIHLFQEHFFASLFGKWIKGEQGLVHGRYLRAGSASRKFVVTRVVQSFPRSSSTAYPI